MNRREALGLFAFALVGCDVASNKGPARVVSIAPSTTEILFAIGAGGAVVGRSRFCDYPPEALALPAVGGFSDPSLEAILALRPTLVVGARGPAGPTLEQALRAHGVETYFPEPESLAQIEAIILELGRRLGHDGEANGVVAGLRRKRAEVEADAKKRPRVRVALLFDVSPIVAAGPGSFPDELMRIAGGDNVVTEGGQYPTLPIERLVALAPAVILDGAEEDHAPTPMARLAPLRDAPGWREIGAMRIGRLRAVSGSEALRPGPRIGHGLELIARAIAEANAEGAGGL